MRPLRVVPVGMRGEASGTRKDRRLTDTYSWSDARCSLHNLRRPHEAWRYCVCTYLQPWARSVCALSHVVSFQAHLM